MLKGGKNYIGLDCWKNVEKTLEIKGFVVLKLVKDLHTDAANY